MRVMVIGIHPDDIELGCGGTVAVCAARGDEVTLVDLSRGESSTNGTPEEREREANEAAAILGARRRVNAGFPDTGVKSEDPEQLRVVVRALREHRPHVALLPSADDPHPDHAEGAKLVERAVFLSAVKGFATDPGQERWRVPRTLVYPGRRDVRPDVVVDITDAFATKMRAIRTHRSQFGPAPPATPTPLNDPRFLSVIESRDRLAGHRIGTDYGEAFMLLAPLGLTDLSSLILAPVPTGD